VVGTSDVENVELQTLTFLPAGRPALPFQAGSHPAGSIASLRSIRARILDSESREPITAATIRVNEKYSPAIDIGADGRFEIHELLPGRYTIDIQTFEYQRITQSVDLDDEDVFIELKTIRRSLEKN
jgi:hypothetical protein